MLRRGIAIGAGLCVLLVSVLAYADATTGLDPYEEFGKHIQAAQTVAPLSDDAFGDRISLFDGATEFDVTDFSIPGNNTLPVALGRRFQAQSWPRNLDPGNLGGFGEWDLDIPYLEAEVTTDNGWTLNGGSSARCSDTTDLLNTHVPGPAGSIVAPLNIIGDGDQLHIPGMGNQQLLVNDQSKAPAYASAGTYKWVTTNHWKVSCLGSTANGYPGEAFVAVSPEGVTYTLSWAVVHSAPSVLVLSTTNGTSTTNYYADRERVFLLVTNIQDRFGNSVTYSYDSSNHLTGITSSDGRSISLTWSGDNIVSASSSLGNWTYQYGTDANGHSTLTRVSRPDGSAWTYTINSGSLVTSKNPLCSQCQGDPPPPPDHCQLTPYPDLGTFDFSITAPSGATAEYSFQYQRHYRTGVPWSCPDGNPDHAYPEVYDFYDAFTITSKQITGPGLPSGMSWTYNTGGTYDDTSGAAPGYFYATVPYDSSALVYLPGGSCSATAPSYNVSVTGPVSEIQYAFGKTYGCNSGRLYGTQVEDLSGHVFKTTTTSYVDETAAPNEPFPSVIGEDQLGNFVHPTGNRLRPVTRATITQDGVTFTTAANSFDAFARVTSASESSTLGYSRTDTTTYADDTSRWVLGLVTQTATNGIAASQTSYDSLDRPTSAYAFGRLVSTKAWNADGTLASVTDGDNHVTSFSSWYRGLPGKVTFADSTSESATINGNGWITALTDENGFTTNYAYDAMGRLAQISYPTGDDVVWNPTYLSFTQVSGSEFGIPAGHWKQVVHTGNDYAVTYFDAFWRPLVTEHYDAGNQSGTLSQTVQQYDAGDRKVFVSYPTASATSYTQSLPGIHTSHDALNRVTGVDQDSELGLLPTTTQYLSGFETEVTDPRGNSTITSYQAYGSPTTEWPVSITAPAGELTEISRDVFGKPLSITRTGTASGSPSLTRTFAYDAYQQLCSRTEPETGATAYGYDAAGNLIWSASGLAAATGCYSQSQASSSGRMVTRSYDVRNRVTAITYPDGFSNTTYAYAPDGAVSSQSVANGGFPVTTSYTYDKRRRLTSETQSPPNTSPFALGYGYDANGHLASTVYPDSRTITYLPNALGQPTQAGTYATGVTYYPNGTIAGFTYGSGAVYTASEDERGLVSRATDALNGTAGMDFAYNHDGDGNLAAITDNLPGNVGNVDMTYDALDRLTEADSPMFGGTTTNPGKALYGYDVFNNLASAQVGNQSAFDYVYNAQDQLAELTDPSSGTALVNYAYDAQGNLAKKNAQVYQFDMADRLASVPGLATYRYDASGRRVQKVEIEQGETLDSDYSRAGNLMYQWNPANVDSTDYIYLGSTLVTRVVGNKSTVIGNIDGVPTASNPTVGGWACSTGIADSISVEIFAGASGSGGTRLGTVTANQPSESAVASSCGTNGANYRFTFTLTETMRAQYAGAAIYVYGDSPVGNGNNALTNSGQYTIPANPTAPPAPASISVPSSSSTGNITVSWSSATTATSYVVQQQLNSGSWTQVYSGSGTSINLSGLGNGSYVYRVQACNSVGCSGFTTSSTLTVALIPAPPASISVPASSYSASIAVSWSASANASNYVLEERINGGSWGVAFNGDATSTTVTVSASGTYQFQISACGAGGCSGFTTSGNVAVTLPPASAPSLSGPSSSTSGTYTLSWSTVAGATRYQLNQNLNGTVTTPYNASGTSWSSSNLGNGTYSYQVFACNAAGCGPGSSVITVSVLHVPAPPASVTAPSTAYLSTPFTVSWSASSGATSYTLQQTDTNNGVVTTKYTGSGTSASVNEGLPGYYTFEVKACNASGCSGWRGAPGMTDVERSGGGTQAVPASGSSL